MSETPEARCGASSWGPLAEPWNRNDVNPIVRPRGETKSVQQNGLETILCYGGRWVMLTLLRAEQMWHVTFALQCHDCLAWAQVDSCLAFRPQEAHEGCYASSKATIEVGGALWFHHFGKVGVEERLRIPKTRDLPMLTRHAANPVLTACDAHLSGQRAFPDSVVWHKGTFYHFCDLGFDYEHLSHARACKICLVTSQDGIHLIDSPVNLLLSPGWVTPWMMP